MDIKEMKIFKEYSEINKELLNDIKEQGLEFFEIVGKDFDKNDVLKTNEVMTLQRIVKSNKRHILYFKREMGDLEVGLNEGNLKLFNRKLIAWK